MRLRHIKGIEEKIASLSDLIITDPVPYKGKWNKYFHNDNPIYMEIGCGKGKFIIENAIKYPNINFIGCEINSSIIYKAAKQVKDNNLELNNLVFLNYDAIKLLDCLATHEISKIYLNFSDPWPKNRHEKRRLTSKDFIEVYRDVLIPHGEIEFKTDNRLLFEYSIMMFNEMNLQFENISLDLHNENNKLEEYIITTEYEEKFMGLNQIIYYVKVRL